MYLYLNGDLVPEEEARIPATDHGFLFGAGLFETFRTFNGNPILLDRHIARLLSGCSDLRIEIPHTFLIQNDRFREITRQLLDANGWRDAVFRYTVSAGESSPGLPSAPYTRPTELLVPRALPRDRQDPISLHLLKTRRNSPEFHPRPKSTSYLNSLFAHFELRERPTEPGDEGILLTPQGNVSEGITSNLFILRENGIETPSTRHDPLPGVTRQAIIELADRAGISVRQGDLTPSDLSDAEGIFITNSVRGPVPAARMYGIEGKPIWSASTASNRLYRTLRDAYWKMVLRA